MRGAVVTAASREFLRRRSGNLPVRELFDEHRLARPVVAIHGGDQNGFHVA
jgi:hypothetical protein